MKMLRKTICAVLALALVLSVGLLPVSAVQGTIASGAATVTASALNIRAGQGTDTSIEGLIPNGGTVVVLEKSSDDWYKIFYNGTTGYVASRYLTEVKATADLSATGKVTGTDVRCRSGAGTSYDVLGYVTKDASYTVTGIEDGWYRINFSGKTGYVRSDYVQLTGSSSTGSSQPAPSNDDPDLTEMSGTGTVIGYGVRIRSAPNTTTSEILGYYPYGATYSVLGKTGNWYKLQYNSSSTTYIYADYLRINSEGGSGGYVDYSEDAGQRIANFALQFVGYDYVYGGAGPYVFDCSGLVYYTLTNLGYTNIDRCADDQYDNVGTWITRNEVKAGDLVFFSSNGYSVTHVGIAISDTQFVHASSPGVGVIISDLYSDYYTRVYFGAKRVAN